MQRRLMAALMTSLALMGLMRSTWADSVDDYLKAQMAARHIPGLSVAVVQNGKVVKSQGYGLSDTAAKTPATEATVYEIGSLTKQFTATAILRLVHQEKVGVDDKITRYLSGLPTSWKVITVRELLNQTSGIPNYRAGLDIMAGAASKDYTAAEVIALVAAKPLLFAPGTQFAYSNTNYHLLGMIVEKVSGKSYADFLQQAFFRPLEMTHTRMTHPGLYVPNQAKGTLWDGSAVQGSPIAFSPTINFGDDGILSTVTDLVKWNAALERDRWLTPDDKRLLWTPPTLPAGAPTGYGCGWFVIPLQNHRLLWHNGATVAGFTGAIFKFPGDKVTLIVLTNSLDIPGLQTSLPLYALTLGLAKLYLPDLAQPDAGIPDTDPQIAALVKTVAAQIASGTLDKSLLTPAYAALLPAAALDSAHSQLAPLGPITSLILVRRDPDGQALYRAQYGTGAIEWQIAVDKDHKITYLLFHSVQQDPPPSPSPPGEGAIR